MYTPAHDGVYIAVFQKLLWASISELVGVQGQSHHSPPICNLYGPGVEDLSKP